METKFIYTPALNRSKYDKTPSVLLIRGLESFKYTLSVMTWRFRKAGWNVIRFRYPCHKYSLYDVTDKLERDLSTLTQLPDYAVGYSMGGVILSELLRAKPVFPRVVLLGSPLLYSQMAALTLRIPFMSKILGPALLDLAKPRIPYYNPDIQYATIAGYGTLPNRKTNPFLSGANDGLVQVKEAHPEWSKNQTTIYSTHPELVIRKKPFLLTENFLTTGKLVN